MDAVRIKKKFDFFYLLSFISLDMVGDIFVGMVAEQMEIIEHTV